VGLIMATGPIKSLINWHLCHVKDYIYYIKQNDSNGIKKHYIVLAENHLKSAKKLVKEMENV
jgi:hypothetical protein